MEESIALWRSQDMPLPGGVVAVSPITDLTLSSPSIDSPAGEDMLARPVLEHITAQYLDGAAPDQAPQSSLHGDLADLPPLLIVAGGDEALLDDARRFADAASAAGALITWTSTRTWCTPSTCRRCQRHHRRSRSCSWTG